MLSKNIISKLPVGRKHSVNWNHTDSIINWNQKYTDSVHIDPNHTDSNQPIPDGLTNIGSIQKYGTRVTNIYLWEYK